MSKSLKKWTVAAAVALLLVIVTAVPASAQDNQEAERIAIQALKEKLDSGETFLLIDVREDSELEEHGAIAGAIHIPMGELEARMNDIPRDIELVFY